MDTRVFYTAATLLLLSLMVAQPLNATGKMLKLGKCPVTVHTHELHQDFAEMRPSIVTEDKHIGTRILSKRIMKELQPLESCCFLKDLLDFYVETVFSSYTASQSQFRRNTSNLANAFLIIKKDLHKCHTEMRCQCGPETKQRMEAIRTSYGKLEPKDAAIKAIGELDSLLEWMDTFKH